MNILKQTSWLIISLLILLYSGWYFAQRETIVRLDSEALSTTIDTTITKLTLSQFDESGQLLNRLQTPLVEHLPKGDVHFLQTPAILITQDNQTPWEINSLRAISYNNGERIVFKDNVVINQRSGKKNQDSTLKTEEVTYFPNEKKATSDLLVTFEQPGHFIQSKGMIAYLDEKRVELLHQARGSYEPNKG